jgi:hypothetical protein
MVLLGADYEVQFSYLGLLHSWDSLEMFPTMPRLLVEMGSC